MVNLHQAPSSLGIDVAHYEFQVDWQQVLHSGVSFGFAKATEGLHTVDDEFTQNWERMAEVGITRGAYHFFHGNEDGTAQANYFLDTVGSLLDSDLPPALDLESADGVDPNTYTAAVQDWVSTVQTATGKVPIIYGSPSFLDNNLNPVFGDNPLWVAHYTLAPQPKLPRGWNNWTFWQYTDRLNVLGVSNPVDANRFQGTHSELITSFGL